MFYTVENTDICNFTADTIPPSNGLILNQVMRDVEHDCSILVEWFRDNCLTLNADKYHLRVSGYRYELMSAKIGDALG